MIILVAGIHGVGKTWHCEHYAHRRGVLHSSAMGLVRQVLASVKWSDDRYATNRDRNRQALELALTSIAATGNSMLLEGNVALMGKRPRALDIDLTAFERLSLGAIVLLESEPWTVLQRLPASHASATEVEVFQQQERDSARAVARHLQIPLMLLRDCTEHSFGQTVDAWLKRGQPISIDTARGHPPGFHRLYR
jgi:adenylate kinase